MKKKKETNYGVLQNIVKDILQSYKHKFLYLGSPGAKFINCVIPYCLLAVAGLLLNLLSYLWNVWPCCVFTALQSSASNIC